MRASLRAGLLLTAAALVVIVVSKMAGLDIEAYAVSGVATGAVIGLVPDRSPGERLGAFAAGFVAAFVGYALRALVLPDTTGGLAVGVVVVFLLCTVAALAGAGRHLPLWAVLLGAGAFCGVYEAPFTAAVAEMATTSIDVATSLLATAGVGFVVAALAAPGRAGLTASPRVRAAATAGNAPENTSETTTEIAL